LNPIIDTIYVNLELNFALIGIKTGISLPIYDLRYLIRFSIEPRQFLNLISIYPTSKMFDKLNDLNRAKVIVVVPWTKKEREEWIKTWNPEIIGGDEIEIGALDIDVKLESALTALTTVINVSTGLTHFSDRESAIQLLQILHRNGIQLKPDDMKTWALQNGWTSDGANTCRISPKRY